jgi:adenosine deaminase CECR1
LRSLIFVRYILAEDAKTKLEIRELLLIFREVINEIKAEMKAKGREDEFAGLKVSLISVNLPKLRLILF